MSTKTKGDFEDQLRTEHSKYKKGLNASCEQNKDFMKYNCVPNIPAFYPLPCLKNRRGILKQGSSTSVEVLQKAYKAETINIGF